MLLRSSDPNKSDSFQLSNPDQGTVYRFQCDSEDVAEVWMKVLEEATKRQTKVNILMLSFDAELGCEPGSLKLFPNFCWPLTAQMAEC